MGTAASSTTEEDVAPIGNPPTSTPPTSVLLSPENPGDSGSSSAFVSSSSSFSYAWPENLHVELRDMAALSFLVYTFGYILDVARQNPGLIKGLSVSPDGHTSKSTTSERRLARSFTPLEVRAIVDDNLDLLAAAYPSEFGENGIEKVRQSLQLLQDRVGETAGHELQDQRTSRSIRLAALPRPLTLLEYDDKHQQHEMVYAVCKDDINRRITLVFRGTENELAFGTNWTTNISFSKVQVDVPDVLRGVVADDQIWMHSGFYNYVFRPTHDSTDDKEKRKYDEVLEDILPLLQQFPGYKLYVTGHSLGAALSTVVSFFLACDPKIANHPVSCINFASPRVGDALFLEATQYLQETNRLRLLRVVNDGDSIAMVPMWGYQHAGFQVRLYADGEANEPEITFPRLVDSSTSRFSRTWRNSLLTSLNVSYDHGDYRERVELSKKYLEKQELNELYKLDDLTGFGASLDKSRATP